MSRMREFEYHDGTLIHLDYGKGHEAVQIGKSRSNESGKSGTDVL